MENETKLTDETDNNDKEIVSVNFSSSKQEEIFMYLSIFVALIAYRLQLNVLMWVFGIKACIDGLASISTEVSKLRRKKKNLR